MALLMNPTLLKPIFHHWLLIQCMHLFFKSGSQIMEGQSPNICSQSNTKHVTPILICGLMDPFIQRILPLECLHFLGHQRCF